MKQMWKLVAVIVAIVLAGFISFLVWREKQAEREQEMFYMELQSRLLPLEQERSRIKHELDGLKASYTQEAQGMASVTVLFTDLDEKICTNMYPKLNQKGYIGVLALPVAQLPGQSGCMNQMQFNELMEAGWKCCLKWEPEMDPEEWMKACEMLIQSMGITRPDVVYFPNNTYSKELEGFLTGKGIQIVVHHGEENMPLVSVEFGDGIWYPGAKGLQEPQTARLLDEVVKLKGNIIYTVGSDYQGENYDQEQFDSMVEWLSRYCADNTLVVTDVWGAWEYHQSVEDGQNGLRKEYEERRKELEKELAGVNKKMDGLLKDGSGE